MARDLIEYNERLLFLDKKLQLATKDYDEMEKIRLEMAVTELLMKSDIGDNSIIAMRDALDHEHTTISDMLTFNRHRAWIEALTWILSGEMIG
jgi:hypothetical protein